MVTTLDIRASDRVLISGVTGWLGRELVSQLSLRFPQLPILGVGRKPQSFLVAQRTVPVVEWGSPDVRSWKPTLVCHLAFVTREFVAQIGEQAFRRRNVELRTSGLQLLEIPSVRSSLIVSSGAADACELDTYGELKKEEEFLFATKAGQAEIPLMIARAWSLSGAYCTKPNEFLFYSFISQAMSNAGNIVISNSLPVRRKYVDAGEFLMTALLSTPVSGVDDLNSGGTMVEAYDLAEMVQKALGVSGSIRRCLDVESGNMSEYFSTDQRMFEKMQTLGIHFTDIEGQVHKSKAVFQELELTE